MAGNSQRRGARRDATKKKGASVGSGGNRRRALEGKGPTPKAEDRKGHYQNRKKRAVEKRASTGARRTTGASGARRSTKDPRDDWDSEGDSGGDGGGGD